MTTAPISICALGASLGEGPVWVARDRALWFVDIKQKRIHRFDPQGRPLESWNAPAQVGWVLPADDGSMVAGLQGGLHRFDPAGGGFTLLAEVEADRPGNRLNDAVTDPAGRIWFGTMDDAEKQPSGAYYRFEKGRVEHAGHPPLCITNGPAISPDGRILYTVDTLGGRIFASDLSEDGSAGTPRLFAHIPAAEGHPDGPTVDSEGCLWVGLFAGWQARRYAPTGELIETIRFPVANVTKLAFGGEDLRTVFATTARINLAPEDLERQPEAGNLFTFRADVPGLPVTPVAL
ncbi:SMP-30/gluconolactonase/LRE family protein [Sphingosinicella sp. CPCC 101087]|uniref:SMP-30/gluconolactonase/LRE family protein n=1 Tax=Sphingosinicella sp. CPCC 101087 TaxID=2497754 RepID=UPI00101CB0FB|nr:SMP-30/gluconolactonase/LRE family protein [Sphingosinicella sp. CPCC 101087]